MSSTAVDTPIPLRIGAERRTSDRTHEVRAPWDGALVARVALASPADLTLAIERAEKAGRTLATASAHQRRAALDHAAAWLGERAELVAKTIVAEAGKPIRFARGEVDRALLTIRTAAEEAVRLGGEVVPLEAGPSGAGRRGLVRRFPRGVVGAISPFNFPINLLAHKVAPAIACGCPVVAKPSEKTPLAGHLLGDAIAHGLAKAGLPEDALSVLPALPRDASPLIDDPRVKVLSFTGGATVGWRLKERAAKKQVQLELGGDGAVIVWGDTDLEAAAKKCALAAFAYAGQVCISVQRVYVQEKAYPAFRERFLAAAKALKMGDPADPDVVIGPLIDDASGERVDAWVDEALAAGARSLLRSPRNGRMLGPVVLESVPPTTKLGCEEVFGPVVYLEPVATFEEALARVNRSPWGLQAGLFTRGLRRVEAAFERLEVGGLIVNDTPMWRIDPMPYGGVKGSGVGREGLRYTIEEYTEPRLMVIAPEDGPVDLDS